MTTSNRPVRFRPARIARARRRSEPAELVAALGPRQQAIGILERPRRRRRR